MKPKILFLGIHCPHRSPSQLYRIVQSRPYVNEDNLFFKQQIRKQKQYGT